MPARDGQRDRPWTSIGLKLRIQVACCSCDTTSTSPRRGGTGSVHPTSATTAMVARSARGISVPGGLVDADVVDLHRPREDRVVDLAAEPAADREVDDHEHRSVEDPRL